MALKAKHISLASIVTPQYTKSQLRPHTHTHTQQTCVVGLSDHTRLKVTSFGIMFCVQRALKTRVMLTLTSSVWGFYCICIVFVAKSFFLISKNLLAFVIAAG